MWGGIKLSKGKFRFYIKKRLLMAICYKNRFPRNVLEASRLEGILVEARIKHEIEHKEEWVVGQWRRATVLQLSSHFSDLYGSIQREEEF